MFCVYFTCTNVRLFIQSFRRFPDNRLSLASNPEPSVHKGRGTALSAGPKLAVQPPSISTGGGPALYSKPAPNRKAPPLS